MAIRWWGRERREQADRTAVWDVMMRYAAACDRSDYAAIEDCFAANARCTYNGDQLAIGKSGVTDYLKERWAAIVERGAPTFAVHFVGNVLIELDGNTATAQTYAVRYVGMPGEHGTVVESRGLQYDDRLVKQAGRWLVTDRVLTGLWESN